MTKKTLFKLLVPVAALLAFCSMASATVIAPGGMVGPPVPVAANGGVQVATTGPVNLTFAGNGFNVTYTEWVYSDPAGVCAGCLDFVIGVTNNASSADIVGSVTASNFQGFTTDVGVNTSNNGGPALVGGVNPNDITRSTFGKVISFDFRPNQLNAGQSSNFLVIRTDARFFVPGFVSVQDGAALTGPGFAPAPEPNMTILMSVLAVGLIGIAYRRKKNVVKNTEV